MSGAGRVGWRWLRWSGTALAILAVGLIDVFSIVAVGAVGLIALNNSREDPEDIDRPYCLAADVPLFQDFRREMARTGAPVQSFIGYHDGDTYAGRAENTAVWLGRLAIAERITPSGYIFRDPAAFIARFGDWPGSWEYWECDLIQVAADAGNWRLATAEDAARRRVVHAAGR